MGKLRIEFFEKISNLLPEVNYLILLISDNRLVQKLFFLELRNQFVAFLLITLQISQIVSVFLDSIKLRFVVIQVLLPKLVLLDLFQPPSLGISYLTL